MFIVGAATHKQTQHLYNFRLLSFMIKGANGLKKKVSEAKWTCFLPDIFFFSILFFGIT